MPSTGIGALIGWGLGAFGKKPKVPTLADINPDLVQAQTTAGNIANFGDIAKLATSANAFNQDQLEALIDRALPGARAQVQKNLGAQLRGEVPQDVRNAIYRANAERGVGAFQGSAFRENVNARDLGLTSLSIMDKALSSAESWLSRSTAPQMDVTSMFFTPQQRLAFSERQQALRYQRDLTAAGVEAAPDPSMAALAEGFDSDVARISNAALSFGGMAAGGGVGSGLGSGVGTFGSRTPRASFGGGFGY